MIDEVTEVQTFHPTPAGPDYAYAGLAVCTAPGMEGRSTVLCGADGRWTGKVSCRLVGPMCLRNLCICRQEVGEMDCGTTKNKDHTTLLELPDPLLIPPWVVDVNFNANLLSEVPERAFAGLVHLKSLFLGTNRITRVDAKAFSGLEASPLQVLDLGRNFITVLPAGILDPIPNLKVFVIGPNRITGLYLPSLAGVRLNILLVWGWRDLHGWLMFLLTLRSSTVTPMTTTSHTSTKASSPGLWLRLASFPHCGCFGLHKTLSSCCSVARPNYNSFIISLCPA